MLKTLQRNKAKQFNSPAPEMVSIFADGVPNFGLAIEAFERVQKRLTSDDGPLTLCAGYTNGLKD